MEIFDNLHEQGNTIILVTHESFIAEHAHHVVHLKDGKIEYEENNKAAKPRSSKEEV
jgi:putative ABC transport system ATP-binding protein